MKLRDGLKTVEKRCISLLGWFLRAAIVLTLVGIVIAKADQNISDARYLLILAVTLVCQGVWGAVLFDCIFRRLGKKE
ncbi:MAG: hypothetical protein E7413_01460 [Ruminococcaceae bacterium]|nr:hypothetical protein [Oscillospiraceae bacterium]